MPLVSIITVNYNHSHLTTELLHSIALTNTYPNVEIIVVDNGSSVNPIPGWLQKYTDIHFIRSENNLGFAGGNNLGIKAAKGAYYFLVNNDTEFTPKLVEILIDTIVHNHHIGIISPKINYYDNKRMIQYAGFTEMNFSTARNVCIGQFKNDNGQYDNIIGKTGFAHGAAMMVKKSAVEKTGLMSENFFLYYEEMDWCERIKKAGFEVWVNTKALIYHKESISVGKNSLLKEFFMNRNRILFIRRNAAPLQRIIFYTYFFCMVTPRNILNYQFNKQKGFTRQLIRAIWWNITNNINSKYLGFY